MSKPTPLAALPKPEFIGNIDTANEEVVRMVGLYNALVGPEGRLTKAEVDLDAANALLETAIKPEALKVETDARVKAEADLALVTKERDEFKAKVDGAAQAALNAAAAAGVDHPASVKGSSALDGDRPASTGATGLQRAIDANVARQADKTPKS